MIHDNLSNITKKLIEMEYWLSKVLCLKEKEIPTISRTIHSLHSLLLEGKFNSDKNKYYDEISKIQYSMDRQRAYDAKVLLEIYDMLSKFDDHRLPRQKLKNIINLPDIAEETTTNGTINGRNTLFELEIASALFKCGFKIIDFDDVTIDFYGEKINFQCKRLHSTKADRVVGNICTAANQFSKKKANCTIGIAVLAAENLLLKTTIQGNDDSFLYQNADSIFINTSSLNTIGNITKSLEYSFANTYLSGNLQKIKYIVSIFLIFRFVTVDNENMGLKSFINLNNIDLTNKNSHPLKDDRSIIKKILSHFKGYCG
jgi:hypothetical protein